MIKKVIAVITIICLLPLYAQAHTELGSADPQPNSTVDKPVTSITLNFEEKVEQAKNVKVKDTTNNTYPVSFIIDGKTIHLSLDTPLSDGDYIVSWDIAGKDGHMVSSQYNFSVMIQQENFKNQNNQSDQNQNAENQVKKNTSSTNNKETDENTTTKKNTTQANDMQAQNNHSLNWVIVILVAMIVLAMLLVLRKKK